MGSHPSSWYSKGMYWLVSLLVLEVLLEGALCNSGATLRPGLRKLVALLTSALLVGVAGALVINAWQVWVWGLPLVGYRLINLLRLYYARLPAQQLRAVSLRAFNWLLGAQVVVAVVAAASNFYHWNLYLFNVLVVGQLLAAVILLRASTLTWQHAAATRGVTPLSDHELPALSVLIPARNETDDLDRCLQYLTASNYPKLEILVLDDCSATRRTPEIIRSFAHEGVRFLQGEVPDEQRWLAKNFAYEQLSQEASGELLLFLGVDALLQPDSLRQLVSVLESRGKDMLSVMPLRADGEGRGTSMLQAMRYYWELCLPRRLFKRPPVLSTCWLIRREALERMGRFDAIRRSVVPESALARHAVTTDAYGFIRGDDGLGIYSNKSAGEQYGTTLRVRYPQLHRRLELVALTAMFELICLLGPLVGLCLAGNLSHSLAYVAIWVVAWVCLFVTYGLASVGVRLTNPWFGWLLMPLAFVLDIAMLHISMWRYEFASVQWKGRNVCIPVMQVEPHLPKF